MLRVDQADEHTGKKRLDYSISKQKENNYTNKKLKKIYINIGYITLEKKPGSFH